MDPGGQDKEAGDCGHGLDGDVQGEGDLEVASIKEKMGEDMVESKADSFVNKILIAANSLTGLLMVLLFHIFCLSFKETKKDIPDRSLDDS